MSYSDFTLEMLKERFDLRVDERPDLYAHLPPRAISSLLQETLRDNVPLALAISTEKARSEMIIAPILIEVRRQCPERVSLFSGVEFTVDPTQGLKGVCDFLLSRSPEQLAIEAPVVTVIEAKNENMKQGIAQALSVMVAAQLYNRQRQKNVPAVYGAVTTGSNWRFLQLTDNLVRIDLTEYYIREVERIVGILVWMLQEEPAP